MRNKHFVWEREMKNISTLLYEQVLYIRWALARASPMSVDRLTHRGWVVGDGRGW